MSDGSAGLATGLAAVGAALAAFLLAGVNLGTMAAGGVGVVAVALGALESSRRLCSLGGLALFVELLLAAEAGLPASLATAAAAAAVLAWTLGTSAVDLGVNLGDAPSRDLELAHVAGTTALVGGAGAVSYAVYRVPVGRVSPLALVLLAVGAAALTAALRG